MKKKKKEKSAKPMPHSFAQFNKEKKRLLTDNMNLRRELTRSKKSKEKLKMKLKSAESAKKGSRRSNSWDGSNELYSQNAV